jgi:hypothetical protein
MSNLKKLFEALKTIKSLPKEVTPEFEAATGEDDEDSIYIDGFIVNEDEDGFFSVMDETNGVDDFAGTGQQILDFFKGVYDAYVENYDEKKSNEFYDKGFKLTESTSSASDDEGSEEESGD